MTCAAVHGDLATGTGAGLAIGLEGWRAASLHIWSRKPDSLFEIGLVSKTFTGLMLAQRRRAR